MAHKILVIDDDRIFVETIKTALVSKHYEVCVAYDGNEGLEQVRSCQPDLIILDVMMPSMDGYAFIRALKAFKVIDREQMMPVIVVTAKKEMEEAFKLEGVREYLIKPLELNKLIFKIEEYLGPNGPLEVE